MPEGIVLYNQFSLALFLLPKIPGDAIQFDKPAAGTGSAAFVLGVVVDGDKMIRFDHSRLNKRFFHIPQRSYQRTAFFGFVEEIMTDPGHQGHQQRSSKFNVLV